MGETQPHLEYSIGAVRTSPKFYETMQLYYIYKDKWEKKLAVGKTRTSKICDMRKMIGTDIYEVLPETQKIHIVQVVPPDVLCNNFLVCLGVVRHHPVIGEPMIVKHLKNDYTGNLNIFSIKTDKVSSFTNAPGTTLLKVKTADNSNYIVKVIT